MFSNLRIKLTVAILIFAVTLVACGNAKLEKGIPFDELVKTGEVNIEKANGFNIDILGDYYLISILDGDRFLLVPENAENVINLPEDITLLSAPLDKTYLVSTSAMDLICKIGAIDNIRLSGTKEKDWFIDLAKENMLNGNILYAGKYSMPDYELILSEGCNLAIENTMIYHNPETKEKLQEVGIPVLVEKSSYERDPLGRLEWIKLYGLLFNHLSEAEDYYNEQAKIFTEIEDRPKEEKAVAFFSITSNGSVTVRKPGDYITKLIDLAGGVYVLNDYKISEENALSTMNIQMEEFYTKAKDADILIYNSSIEGEVESIDDLINKSGLFSDFKAVKDGNVYCTGKNLFQETTGMAEFLKDINSALLGKNDGLTYLRWLE